MSIRAIKRAVARERMKSAGIGRINKKRIWKSDVRRTRYGQDVGGYVSYFSAHWRDFLDPSSAQYKLAARYVKR